MRKGDVFSSDDYVNYAGDVTKLAKGILKKLDPKPNEYILDVGCGDGIITKIIQASGAHVIGIDANLGMVKQAIKNGIQATVQDITALSFPDKTFDKIFSNSTLHWVADLPKALEEIARVLKDDGKIALEFGRKSPPEITKAVISISKAHGYNVTKDNPWHTTNANDLVNTSKLLGFENIQIEKTSKLQNLPNGIEEWLDNFVAKTFLKKVPENDKQIILTEIVESLKKYPNHFTMVNEPEWFADYERISITASLNRERSILMNKYRKTELENTVEKL